MSRQEIPRTATRIIREYGIDDDGNVIVLCVYAHTRRGHALPMFWVVQYREVNRRIQRGSRSCRQYTGAKALDRLSDDLREPLELLAESRERVSKNAPIRESVRTLRRVGHLLRDSRGML